ncbi:unnamed protein product [Brachionus calyciflorus]|uniref:Uncharacterized protein n=1 Tax=Brachionus calyciflorus TaxID=104777 RepID=A0A814IR83_9BILA|nr:unnamed protein product [Brachionus calyciflorus]
MNQLNKENQQELINEQATLNDDEQQHLFTEQNNETNKRILDVHEDFDKQYSYFYNAYKNYLDFSYSNKMRNTNSSKVFRMELHLNKRQENKLFEKFECKASSLKEAKKDLQKEFLKGTKLIHPKDLPKNKENRRHVVQNLIAKNELPSSGFVRDNADDADFTFFFKNEKDKIETTKDRWTVDRAERFEFFEIEKESRLKIFTFWKKHSILDSMPIHYYE